MARGGRGKPQPGKPYGNRTDYQQPVQVVSGQQYGQRQALANAQRTIPLPNNIALPPAPAAAAAPQAPGPPPPVPPGGFGAFDRESERPLEPVTTGLPFGAGPGPEALQGASPMTDTVLAQLHALYAASQDPDILKVIELRQNQVGGNAPL